MSPSEPAIQSCEDAAALAAFAHKYGMTQLLDKAEGHLVEAACKDKGKALFTDAAQLVTWVTLAERCKLDTFLAHAEQFMIKHVDASFWQRALAEVLVASVNSASCEFCVVHCITGRMQ